MYTVVSRWFASLCSFQHFHDYDIYFIQFPFNCLYLEDCSKPFRICVILLYSLAINFPSLHFQYQELGMKSTYFQMWVIAASLFCNVKYNLRDFQQDLLPAIRKHQQLFKTPNVLLLFSYCCDYIFSIHEILLNSKCSNLRQNNWDSSISVKIKAMKLFPSKAKGLKKKNTILSLILNVPNLLPSIYSFTFLVCEHIAFVLCGETYQ